MWNRLRGDVPVTTGCHRAAYGTPVRTTWRWRSAVGPRDRGWRRYMYQEDICLSISISLLRANTNQRSLLSTIMLKLVARRQSVHKNVYKLGIRGELIPRMSVFVVLTVPQSFPWVSSSSSNHDASNVTTVQRGHHYSLDEEGGRIICRW